MSTDFTLHFDPEGAVLETARDCEESVFLQQYGNTAAQWAEEYGPYDASSAFIAVTDRHGEAVATMRLILPGPLGLKTLVDVARPPWNIDGARAARAAGIVTARTWDVATLAIRTGVGSRGLLSAALYHALFRATRANRIRWIVMILDTRVRRLLSGAHIDTLVLPGAHIGPYLGSAASVPLWGEMARMADRQRETNPDAHRLINLGIGLDGISVPEPAQFVLARRTTGIDQPAVPAILSVGRASA